MITSGLSWTSLLTSTRTVQGYINCLVSVAYEWYMLVQAWPYMRGKPDCLSFALSLGGCSGHITKAILPMDLQTTTPNMVN